MLATKPHDFHQAAVLKPPYYSDIIRQKYQLDRIIQSFCAIDESQHTPEQPGIQWEPDYRKYLSRSLKRSQLAGLETSVPTGWPAKIESSLAWTGSELISEDTYVTYLAEDDIAEIRAALQSFNCGLRHIFSPFQSNSKMQRRAFQFQR